MIVCVFPGCGLVLVSSDKQYAVYNSASIHIPIMSTNYSSKQMDTRKKPFWELKPGKGALCSLSMYGFVQS